LLLTVVVEEGGDPDTVTWRQQNRVSLGPEEIFIQKDGQTALGDVRQFNGSDF